MPQVFYRKKFSYYLGEERALDDIVVRYESLIPPTPTGTPSVTPSNTPTPSVTNTPSLTPTGTPNNTPTPTTTPTGTISITPSPTATPTGTPIVTSTPTLTPTPTGTPNPICPQQVIFSATTSGLLYGLYNRETTYTGGTFSSVWYNNTNNTFNYSTNPDGNDYVAYVINSGYDYTTLYWASDLNGNNGKWNAEYSSGNTVFNGGVLGVRIIVDSNSITNDGTYYYPQSGPQQYNGGYIQYPAVCITPTPTGSPTQTPTTTPTPTPSSAPQYNLLAENTNFILAENGDNINIQY